MRSDDEYLRAVIEEIDERFDMIVDLLTTLKDLPHIVKAVEDRLEALGTTVSLIIPVVRDQHDQLLEHQARIRRIESS